MRKATPSGCRLFEVVASQCIIFYEIDEADRTVFMIAASHRSSAY